MIRSASTSMTKRRREAVRHSMVHFVLLLGCVVFAFPFVWLVSTSFKDEREISVFPPKWIPKVPYHSVQSPFVDPTWYEAMKKPAGVDATAWERAKPAIARALDDALHAACRQHPDALPEPALVNSPGWYPALRDGMWDELSRILPDDVAKAPDKIPAFIASSVNAERLTKIATQVSRIAAVGDLALRTERNDRIAMAPSGWKVVSGQATLDREVKIEAESGSLLRYDLSRGPVELERVIRFAPAGTAPAGPAGVPTATAQATGLKDVDSITLGMRLDGSWHRAFLTVETPDAVYRSEQPFWMERSAWQDFTWRFVRPKDRTLPDVTLIRDTSAKPTLAAGAGDVKLRLRLEPSSRWLAGYAKYTLNYRRALRYIPFWLFVGNSFYLVVLNVLGQVLACSLVAYSFARLRFYGRDVLFAILLATMMLPGQVTMIPVFLIFKWLGWYNTLKPLWVGSFFGSAFFIFLLRQFFLGIPQDLEDAARIDGCGFFGTYWRILLPLVRPALASVAIFTFMGTWNEFMGPLIYIGSEHLTPLSLGLFMFRSEHGGEWGMMMAASTLMTLPVVVIFFFAQRYFIQGVTLTGMGGK